MSIRASSYSLIICVHVTALAGFGYSCSRLPGPGNDGITLSWKVCEFELGEDVYYDYRCDKEENNAIKAEVCVVDGGDIPCVDTGDDGVFSLEGLPKNEELLLTFRADGSVPRLVPVQTGYRDVSKEDEIFYERSNIPSAIKFPPLVSESFDAAKLKESGCEDLDLESLKMNEKTGQIAAIAIKFYFDIERRKEILDRPGEGEDRSGPVTDAEVSLLNSDGSDSGIKPVYTNETGLPCYSYDKQRNIGKGYAVFPGLEPGDYLVSFTVPNNLFCLVADASVNRMVWGYRTEKPNQNRVPVMAGYRTITSIVCYDSSVDITERSDDGGV